MEENIEVTLLTKTKTKGVEQILYLNNIQNNTYKICGSGCKAVSNWMHLYF